MERKQFKLTAKEHQQLLQAMQAGEEVVMTFWQSLADKYGFEPASAVCPDVSQPVFTAVPLKKGWEPTRHIVKYGYLMVFIGAQAKRMTCLQPNDVRECSEVCGGFERMDEYTVKLHCCNRIINLEKE